VAERFQVALEGGVAIAKTLFFIGCYGEIEYS